MLLKKYPDISKIKIEDKWDIFQGNMGGNFIIVKLNAGAKHIAGHPAFNTRVGVAIPFKKFKADGMPDSEEAQLFNEIEDQIFEVFQKDNLFIVLTIITIKGMREFMMYSAKPELLPEYIQKLKKSFPDYDFLKYTHVDCKWEGYKFFSKTK